MPLNPYLLSDLVLSHIHEQRRLLGLKAGLPAEKIEQTEGRALGLAHPIFTLGLHDLLRAEARPAQTGVRVMEFAGEKPAAFYDLADAQTGQVQQMTATSPYLDLLPRAIASLNLDPERRFDLRLLRVPALNFEAVWLHAENENDMLVPLRGFHDFAPMQPVSWREAIERLRHAAQSVAQQDDAMGA